MSKGIVLMLTFVITPSEQMFSISAFSMVYEMGQPYEQVYSVQNHPLSTI